MKGFKLVARFAGAFAMTAGLVCMWYGDPEAAQAALLAGILAMMLGVKEDS